MSSLTRVALTVLLFLPSAARAEPSTCSLEGDGWSASFTAPDDWVVKCPGEEGQVPALAHPASSSFGAAPAVLYVTPAPRAGMALEQFVERETASFKADNPHATSTPAPSITTGDGRAAIVRRLAGDENGNVESIAYLDGDAVRLVIVLSARDQASHDAALAAFEAFVAKTTFPRVAAAPSADR